MQSKHAARSLAKRLFHSDACLCWRLGGALLGLERR